jgi:hypothetical protein
MKLIRVPTDISPCDEIALLLEGFWRNQSFPRGRPNPAYQALTGFLLGIRLQERFGSQALRESTLCPVRLHTMPYEAKALSAWCLRAHVCFGQIGYHPMEALVLVFNELYRHIEANPALRTVGGRVLTSEEWAATGVGLALWLDDFGRFAQLREACLEEARSVQDWLTLGLTSVDAWWADAGQHGIPERADVTASILTAPYGDAVLERVGMTHLLTRIKVDGIADEWGGDLDGAVLLAYATGRQLASINQDVYFNLLAHDAESRNETIEEDLAGLRRLYRRYIPSDDHAVWETAIGGAARKFTTENVRVHYLPGFVTAPSIIRAAVDFGFWAGLLAHAVEEGTV